MLTCFPLFTECDSVFDCVYWETCMMMAFSVPPVHGLFSVEALCISWLIQDTAFSNSFMCQCHGLVLLRWSVDVVFPSVVLMLYTKVSFIKHCWCCDWTGMLYVWSALVLPICFVCLGWITLERQAISYNCIEIWIINSFQSVNWHVWSNTPHYKTCRTQFWDYIFNVTTPVYRIL